MPRLTGGQALVEFAIALPVFVLLVFGLIDGGRLVIGYTTLENASRAGARVAIVNQSNDTSCGSERTFKCVASEHTAALGVQPTDIADLAPLDAATCEADGCAVTVTVGQTFEAITPVVGSILGPINLEASTTMPVERLYASP